MSMRAIMASRVLLACAVTLAACTSVRATAPRTAADVARRDSATVARECMLAREDALRTFWLAPMFSLSDPIVLNRGQALGAPLVPKACTATSRDTVRVR